MLSKELREQAEATALTVFRDVAGSVEKEGGEETFKGAFFGQEHFAIATRLTEVISRDDGGEYKSSTSPESDPIAVIESLVAEALTDGEAAPVSLAPGSPGLEFVPGTTRAKFDMGLELDLAALTGLSPKARAAAIAQELTGNFSTWTTLISADLREALKRHA